MGSVDLLGPSRFTYDVASSLHQRHCKGITRHMAVISPPLQSPRPAQWEHHLVKGSAWHLFPVTAFWAPFLANQPAYILEQLATASSLSIKQVQISRTKARRKKEWRRCSRDKQRKANSRCHYIIQGTRRKTTGSCPNGESTVFSASTVSLLPETSPSRDASLSAPSSGLPTENRLVNLSMYGKKRGFAEFFLVFPWMFVPVPSSSFSGVLLNPSSQRTCELELPSPEATRCPQTHKSRHAEINHVGHLHGFRCPRAIKASMEGCS